MNIQEYLKVELWEDLPFDGPNRGIGQNKALFSTNLGRRERRAAYQGQPRQIRSDNESALSDMAVKLRQRFPVECIFLTPSDVMSDGKFPVEDYFDNFDIHFHGPYFLYLVLKHIAFANEAGKAARVEEVDRYARHWIEVNPLAFNLFGPDHQWYDLFHDEAIEEYPFPFLWVSRFPSLLSRSWVELVTSMIMAKVH